MINNLLHAVEAHGLNSLLYNIFFFGGTVAVAIFAIFHAKNYKIPLKKAIPFFVIVYAVSVAWMFFLFWAMSGFKNWGGNNIVRVFPWIMLFAFPAAKLFKLDYLTVCDYIAPLACVQHGVSHFGCIFGGCCYSYPFEGGVYNHVLGYETFPIQPIEALVAVAIVIFIYIREKRHRFAVDGLNYPIMLMLFGYSRFFLEFARDNDKLFFGISELALWALFAGIVGTVMYFYIKSYNKKNSAKAV